MFSSDTLDPGPGRLFAEGSEEACLFSGLNATESSEEIVADLVRERHLVLDEIQRQEDEANERYRQDTEHLVQERHDKRSRLRELARERSDLYQAEETYLRHQGKWGALHDSFLGQLRSRRASYPFRLPEYLLDLQIDSEKKIIRLEEGRLEAAQSAYARNREEFDRRVDHLKERREEVRKELTLVEQKIGALRSLGINRTSAGFLTWAGYFAFPAAGWFLGEALYRIDKVRPDGENAVADLITMLANGIIGLTQHIGAIGAGGVLVAGPLAILLLVYVLLVFSDFLAKRFDSRWDRKQGSSPESNLVKRSSLLHRGDYAQAVARLPLIYLWSLIPLGLAALLAISGGGSPGAGMESIAQPWRAVLFTYLGIVLTVIMAGFSMLYVCFVVETRSVGAATTGSFKSPKKHVELLVALAALLAFSIFQSIRDLVEGISMGSDEYPVIWLLGLLIIGVVVSYGLIYKGLFREQKSLHRKANSLDDAINEFSAAPALRLPDAEKDHYREVLKRVYTELEKFPEPGLPSASTSVTGLVGKWLFSSDSNERADLVGFDFIFEEGLAAKVGRAETGYAVATARLKNSGDRIEEIRDEIESTKQEVESLTERIDEHADARSEIMEGLHNRRLNYIRQYREAINRCKTAFVTGQQLRPESGKATV